MELDLSYAARCLTDGMGTIVCYEENGREKTMRVIGTEQPSRSSYGSEELEMVQQIQDLGDGQFRIVRNWKNITGQTREFVFFTEAFLDEPAHFTLIPSVLYNGNAFGSGDEPKGFEKDGYPWVFAATRSGIPACTISEGAEICAGLFAEPDGDQSCSCSLSPRDNGRAHRIWYPMIERPVAYTNRDGYAGPLENRIRLEPGQCFTGVCRLDLSHPAQKNTGLRHVYDHVLAQMDPTWENRLSDRQVWELALDYAENWLFTRKDGMQMFTIGFRGDPVTGTMKRRSDYEIGWCGQNATYARAFIRDGIRNHDKKHLELGISVLDCWVGANTFRQGLVTTNFNGDFQPEPHADTCNLGWAAWQVLKAWEELQAVGIEKPAWYGYAMGICDFFTDHYSEDWGFGKDWSPDGRLLDPDGTIGAYLCLPLVEAYVRTGRKIYLETAQKALEFYDRRDLQNFACTAGALDTCCVDRETCIPLLKAACRLYELTGEKRFFRIMERGVYYLLSWTWLYDIRYPRGTDFGTGGFCTRGATSVSAQHHHLDCLGALAVPELEKFARFTGCSRWHTLARLMWSNTLWGIAGRDDCFHGIHYPRGAQAEAKFHTNWTFTGDYTGSFGMNNDWCVSWPGAFRILTLMDLEDDAQKTGGRASAGAE